MAVLGVKGGKVRNLSGCLLKYTTIEQGREKKKVRREVWQKELCRLSSEISSDGRRGHATRLLRWKRQTIQSYIYGVDAAFLSRQKTYDGGMHGSVFSLSLLLPCLLVMCRAARGGDDGGRFMPT